MPTSLERCLEAVPAEQWGGLGRFIQSRLERLRTLESENVNLRKENGACRHEIDGLRQALFQASKTIEENEAKHRRLYKTTSDQMDGEYRRLEGEIRQLVQSAQQKDSEKHAVIAKYDKIFKHYQNYKDLYSRQTDAVEKAVAKLRDVRRFLETWRIHLKDPSTLNAESTKTLEVAIDGLLKDVEDNHERTVADEPTSHAAIDESTSKHRVDVSDVNTETEKESSQPDIGQSSETILETPASLQRANDEHYPASCSTEFESMASHQSQERAASDGEVEVISARPVKRMRLQSTDRMPPPVRIKQEPASQGCSISVYADRFDHTGEQTAPLSYAETLDLNNMGEHISTPRRAQMQSKIGAESSLDARSNLGLTSQNSFIPDNSSGANYQGRTSGLMTHGQLNRPSSEPRKSTERIFSAFRKQPEPGRAPLNPLSPNIRSSRTQPVQPGVKLKRECSAVAIEKAAAISEGGELREPLTNEETAKRPHSNPLDSLLNAPPSAREVLPRSFTPDTVRKTSISRGNPPPQRPHSNPKTPRPTASEGAVQQGNTSLKSSTSQDHNNEPLRTRALEQLNLSDFRINPKYMGAEFAFADTIRGKDQRRCLPGCTRLECCGNAFKRAAEIGVLANDNKTDAEVLEAFLGPDWNVIIGAYNAEKRKDLLMQARAFSFANAHGKHRSAFERHSTPPGFWRTDMPNTQEEREDREKAIEMERRKVEERWREALRDNGRWKFRDE